MPGITKNVYLNIDSEADATVALRGVGICQLGGEKLLGHVGIRFDMALQYLRGDGHPHAGRFFRDPGVEAELHRIDVCWGDLDFSRLPVPVALLTGMCR